MRGDKKQNQTKSKDKAKTRKKRKNIFFFSLPLLFLFLTLFLINIFFFSTFISGKNLILDIINNKPENFKTNFSSWQKKTKYFKSINQFNNLLPDLVGINQTKTYFVLLQNNYELRPSGGFMGSYAKLEFKDGGLNNIKVEDIYVPDGQITGHVEPPWPIQQAFGQGFWKLRDSNWEPDFPLASKQISWFFEKGEEKRADTIIALNFLVIKDLIQIFEPIELVDYNFQIKADNFYQIAQKEAEADFFPGSTQKKDFLSALTKQLIFKVKNPSLSQLAQIAKALKKNLNQKQILISANNSDFNQILDELNWNGEVERNYQDQENQISDYIYIVEANLGANKANCCIKRKTEQEINFNNNLVKEKLKLTYFNNSPQEKPDKNTFWGGVYENFLRIIVPLEVKGIKIKINNQTLEDKNQIEIKEYSEKKLKSIGFFVIVNPLSEAKVEIEYEKQAEKAEKVDYLLEIQKQPGIESYSHLIKIPSQNLEITKTISTDEKVRFKLN